MMNSSHKWARLFSQIGLYRTFLKQSSILLGVSDKSWGHRKVGDSVLLRLFNGGWWCSVSPLKCLKYYMPVGEL